MIFVTAAICWFAVFLLTPVAIRLSNKFDILDHPATGGMHKQATPMLGGVLCCLVFIIATIVITFVAPASNFTNTQIFILLSSVAMVTAIGLFDDIFGLKASIKIILQAIPVGLICFWLVEIDRLSIPFMGEYQIDHLSGKALVFVWLIVIMNSVNIIDGLDGLLSCFAGVYFLSIGMMDYFILQTGIYNLAFIASAVSFGFLFHNWPNASIFLGNSGSNFLGFLIALLPVLSNVKTVSLLNYTPFIILLSYPLLDTAYAVFRRLSSGRNIFQGDNRHIHHLIFIFGRRKKSYLLVMLALFILNSGLSFLILVDQTYALFLTALCFSLNIGIINSYISKRKIAGKGKSSLVEANLKAHFGNS